MSNTFHKKTPNIIFDGLINIGLNVYVEWWKKSEDDKQKVKTFIVNFSSPKSILSMLYGTFVYRKEILSIDEMPVEFLDDLESEAKAWHPGIEGKELEKLMRCIWAMNHLIIISESL